MRIPRDALLSAKKRFSFSTPAYSSILYGPRTSHTSQSISDDLAQRELACTDAIKANSAFVLAVGFGLGFGPHVCESLTKTKPHLACLCKQAKAWASPSCCRRGSCGREALETIKKSGLRPKAIPHFKGQFPDQRSELANWQGAA